MCARSLTESCQAGLESHPGSPAKSVLEIVVQATDLATDMGMIRMSQRFLIQVICLSAVQIAGPV